MTTTAKPDYPEFDHASAWYDFAKPQFEALAPEVRALYTRVCVECEKLQQKPNLLMPWPDAQPGAPSLREAFEAFDCETLAYAARVVYFYGHWSVRSDSSDGAGGTWKFAHYADQVLRSRLLKIPGWDPEMNPKGDHGTGFMIHEGVLRYYFASRDEWTWNEFAPATAENLAAAKTIANTHYASTRASYGRAMEALVASLTPTAGPWAPWFETKKYMRPRSEIEALREARMSGADRLKRAYRELDRIKGRIIAANRRHAAEFQKLTAELRPWEDELIACTPVEDGTR